MNKQETWIFANATKQTSQLNACMTLSEPSECVNWNVKRMWEKKLVRPFQLVPTRVSINSIPENHIRISHFFRSLDYFHFKHPKDGNYFFFHIGFHKIKLKRKKKINTNTNQKATTTVGLGRATKLIDHWIIKTNMAWWFFNICSIRSAIPLSIYVVLTRRWVFLSQTLLNRNKYKWIEWMLNKKINWGKHVQWNSFWYENWKIL